MVYMLTCILFVHIEDFHFSGSVKAKVRLFSMLFKMFK